MKLFDCGATLYNSRHRNMTSVVLLSVVIFSYNRFAARRGCANVLHTTGHCSSYGELRLSYASTHSGLTFAWGAYRSLEQIFDSHE